MQRVEFTDYGGGTIFKVFCPFCGAVALADDGFKLCSHTLFTAVDEGGFEFLSPKLGLDKDVDTGDMTVDEFTDQIDFKDAVKFAIYESAPSCFGAYIGFAPAATD